MTENFKETNKTAEKQNKKTTMESAKVETITKIKENKMKICNTQEQNKELCEVQKLSANTIAINKREYIDSHVMQNWFELLRDITCKESEICSRKYIPDNIRFYGDIQDTVNEFLNWLHSLIDLKYKSFLPFAYQISDKAQELLNKVDSILSSNDWFYLFVIYRDIFNK